MLREMLAARSLGHQLASIRTVAPTGGEIARDPEGSAALLADTCASCAREDGAEAVILGGAGLIGIAEMIQPRLAVEIVCSNAAGFRATARALDALHGRTVATTDKVETIGLGTDLTELFRTGSGPG